MNLLGIFAKQPTVGAVKTRLAAATSAAFAQRVAQGFLEDTLDRCAKVDAERSIVYAPAAATAFFQSAAGGQYELTPQEHGDLGQRLQSFFTQARQRGFTRIIAIGADSPTLPIEWIADAFIYLESHDVVIGPAVDGGYYLIGVATREFNLFDAIPWSTSRVLGSTMERLKTTDARLALLPPWYDVDTVDDWTSLCGHVKAMRLAGINPGVPATEHLIADVAG